jgi:putative transposase
MHQATEEPRITHLLRRCTYAGRPFGAAEFVDRIESQISRKWRRPKLAVLA